MNTSPNPRRSERATQALPQGAAEALFTITGGRIVVIQIVGEVTTVLANTANNTKLVNNPTTGTSQDLCAVLDVANDEVGTLYGISGLLLGRDARRRAGAGRTDSPRGPQRPWDHRPQLRGLHHRSREVDALLPTARPGGARHGGALAMS